MSQPATIKRFGVEYERRRYCVVHRKKLLDGTPAFRRSMRVFGHEHQAERHIINLFHQIESGFVIEGSIELFEIEAGAEEGVAA